MKPYFIHSTAKSGRRFTLAAYVDNTNGHYLRIGTALCSKQDQFVKLTGRNKALGRAKSNKLEDVKMGAKSANQIIKDCQELYSLYKTYGPPGRIILGYKIAIFKATYNMFPQSCKELITAFIEAFAENN